MTARRRSATVPDHVSPGSDAAESAWRAETRLPVAHFDYVPTLCTRPEPSAADLRCLRCDWRLRLAPHHMLVWLRGRAPSQDKIGL